MTRFEVAAKLGLVPHEWHWEDPENSEIWCRHCRLNDPMEPKTPCSSRAPPSAEEIREVIERRRRASQRRVAFLDDLEAALEHEEERPDLTLNTVIKTTVRAALIATGGNKKNAALRLGIGQRTIYRHVDRHDLHEYCTGERKK